MFVIVGATGKVGRATIAELRALGRPVRAVVRNRNKAAQLERAGCEVVVADVDDAQALTTAFVGAEAVQVICPMAVQARDALTEMTSTVASLGAALEAARPPAVLAISDYGAEVEGDTGITRLFHRFEARLKRLDTRLTLLRSAEQMENWARYLGFAAKTGILPSMHQPLTKAFPTVAAVDVGGVAASLLLTAASAPGQRVVHVEGPQRYTPHAVAAVLSSVLARDVKAHALPRGEWLSALSRAGLGASYSELVVALFDAHNAGKIDTEKGVGEVRLGQTELVKVAQSIHTQE